MSVDAWDHRGARANPPKRDGFRPGRLIMVILGAAVMALSGGGLAGYLDLAAATPAPAPPADAPPLG